MARKEIIGGLRSEALVNYYGLRVELTDEMAEMLIRDGMGDKLDALLCGVQAGWAFLQRDSGYGLPAGHEIEGWIVDPGLSLRF